MIEIGDGAVIIGFAEVADAAIVKGLGEIRFDIYGPIVIVDGKFVVALGLVGKAAIVKKEGEVGAVKLAGAYRLRTGVDGLIGINFPGAGIREAGRLSAGGRGGA